MIDTDKYEGHTPAPWCWEEKRNIEITTMADGYEVAEVPRGNDADAHLIADAPLLLAEVKRLRDAALTACKVLMKHYEWMSVNDATSEEDDQEILNIVTLLREASE